MGVLSTYTKYVLIIVNNETKLSLLMPTVAEFGYMWFPDVVFAILFRQRYTLEI